MHWSWVGDHGDLLMSWFPWNLIARLGSGWLTIPGASEEKTQKLRSEATNELNVVDTKTSLQLEPGKSTGSIPVLRMSLVQETVRPTVQETSDQARPLQKGGLFSSTPVTRTLGSNQRQAFSWHEMISHQIAAAGCLLSPSTSVWAGGLAVCISHGTSKEFPRRRGLPLKIAS